MNSESSLSDRKIVTVRIVNAPQEIVFRAWTDPNHLINWWGPEGFTNTFHEFDLKPGGIWWYTMHGPEKGNYQNECRFLTIIENKFVSWDRISQPLFMVETSFEDLSNNKTKVIFNMIFDTPEACEKLRKFVPEKNEENMDKLEAELIRMMANENSTKP